MAHLFIAYHHADVEGAYQLQNRLEEAGYSVWINPDPEAGEKWAGWAEPALRDSFAVIPLLTEAGGASEIVAYEWAYACGADVPVIPLAADGVTLHPRLAALEPIRFQDTFPWDALLARVHCEALKHGEARMVVPPDASPAVIEAAAALHSSDAADRTAALDTLAHLDEPAAHAMLRAAVQHPIYCDLRMAAVHKMAEIGGDEALQGLLAALYDADWDVMRTASQALVAFGDAAVPGLMDALHSKSRGAWSGAVWALAGIHTPAVIPGLIDALRLRGWFGPRTAAVVLGELRDPSAVPALIEALKSEDESLVALAQDALRKIGTPEALAAVGN